MSDEQKSKGPSHLAYQVSKGKEGQAHFNRIGAGFPHNDGKGIDVVLNSVPVDGRVTLRTMQERLDDFREGNAEAQPDKGQSQER